VNALQPAMRIEPLVTNSAPFCSKPEDRFKVWPTNRDRPAFNAVMSAPPPIDYDAIGHRGERMVDAHRFFSERAREWLMLQGLDSVGVRAAAIETVVRELVQIVVIDLAVDENAQEIFETLNARGAQLTAADLIKNFIFQRLLEKGTDVEDAYQKHWKEFETGFWETEISVGRLRYPRSSIFLNHWLVARSGEEVVAREVFDRFKRFADHDAGLPMASVLEQVHRAAAVYRDFPLNLDNLARRVIIPAIEKCVRCRQSESEHETDGHSFQLDKTLQWHAWHSFRRGLATNLHALGVQDKTIQQILRHSNIAMTQNVYIKSLAASGVSAMDLLGAEMKKEAACNSLATNRTTLPN
jgi:hypothetical protein